MLAYVQQGTTETNCFWPCDKKEYIDDCSEFLSCWVYPKSPCSSKALNWYFSNSIFQNSKFNITDSCNPACNNLALAVMADMNLTSSSCTNASVRLLLILWYCYTACNCLLSLYPISLIWRTPPSYVEKKCTNSSKYFIYQSKASSVMIK